MKHILIFIAIVVVSGLEIASASVKELDPCVEANGWRKKVCQFALTELQHPAWGYTHSKRDYVLATILAQKEKILVDDDVLFAAAFLHDVGAFPKFQDSKNPEMDHSLRSNQVISDILKKSGFPMRKLALTQKAIRHHMYNDPTIPSIPEGIVLHNADTIDFLGTIGIARVFSLIGKEVPTFEVAFLFLSDLSDSPESKLYGIEGSFTRELGLKRAKETKAFLSGLSIDNAKMIKQFTDSLVDESFGMLGN